MLALATVTTLPSFGTAIKRAVKNVARQFGEEKLLKIEKTETRLVILFIIFLGVMALGIYLCTKVIGISPVAGGLLLLTFVVAIMIGETLPERIRHLRFWYYMMLIALGMILFGLIKSGTIPVSSLALVPMTCNSLTSLAIIETCIILIIASIAFWIFARIVAKKIKPKTATPTHTLYTRRGKKSAIAYA